MEDKGPGWDRLLDVAPGQAGYFTVAQASSCGFSTALLAYHSRGGRLLHVGPRLYRFSQYPSSSREEVMRAWLAAGPEAVVSHESALDLLGLSDIIPDQIHITVPRSFRWLRLGSGVAVHTVTEPLRPAETVIRGGIRTTSPTRTILDVAQMAGAPDRVVQAVRDAVEQGLASSEDLLAGGAERGRTVRNLIGAALAE